MKRVAVIVIILFAIVTLINAFSIASEYDGRGADAAVTVLSE